MANYTENLLQGTNYDPDVLGAGPVPQAPRAYLTRFRMFLPQQAQPTMPVGKDTVRRRFSFWPFLHKAFVIGQAAVSPTAAVMTSSGGAINSWDWKYGIVGQTTKPSYFDTPLRAGTIPTTGM